MGNLSLSEVRTVLDALDHERRSTHEVLGVAHHALGPPPGPDDEAPAIVEAREAVGVGTVVYEAVLVALRRLAQEHHSANRFPNRQ